MTYGLVFHLEKLPTCIRYDHENRLYDLGYVVTTLGGLSIDLKRHWAVCYTLGHAPFSYAALVSGMCGKIFFSSIYASLVANTVHTRPDDIHVFFHHPQRTPNFQMFAC